jgi:hypothetical protein
LICNTWSLMSWEIMLITGFSELQGNSSFKKGNPKFSRQILILETHGLVSHLQIRISWAKELMDSISWFRNFIINVFDSGHILSSALHATFDVLQWTFIISLINLEFNSSKGCESISLIIKSFPPYLTTIERNW